MNSIMERWIQACRHELLDRTLIFNQVHLLHKVSRRPLARFRIHRRDRLGELLHEYD
jgi:putative transposase